MEHKLAGLPFQAMKGKWLGTTGAAWTYLTGRDALNSVRQETDAAGQVLAARSFDPYGVVLSGDGGTPFGYSGEYRDSASGLLFLRARYLQPQIAILLSRDPLYGEGGEPGTENGWNYVDGNPISHRDPTGMIKEGAEAQQADSIIALLASSYNVVIAKDYGPACLTYGVSESIAGACSCLTTGWQQGRWRTVDELSWTQRSIELAVNAMSGAERFKRAMKSAPIVLSRWPSLAIPVYGPVRPFAPPVVSLQPLLGDVVLPDSAFDAGELYAEYAIVHELGHVWDARTYLRLSLGLGWAIGTLRIGKDPLTGANTPPFWNSAWEKEPPPGWIRQTGQSDPNYAHSPLGPLTEDWAEAFATYVDPAWWNAMMRETTGPGNTMVNTIGPLRSEYVRDQISSIQ